MELFQILGTISVNNAEANKAIDDTNKKAGDGEKKQSKAFAGIGKAATKLGKGVLGVGAALGGAFVMATEGTREYRKSMGQLETAFATMGHGAGVAQSTYSELNAVLGDSEQAIEASQQLAKLTDDEAELDRMTHALTGVYATFGNSLPIEGLAEATNHTAKVGEVQGGLADALEWSGISLDSFNGQLAKCTTEQERQELITSTLNDLYGEAGTKYKELNKDVIEAEKSQAKLTDAFAKIGAILDPIMTAIKTSLAGALETALPFIEALANQIPVAIETIRNAVAIAMPYIETTFNTVWTVLKTVWDTIGKPIFEAIKEAVNGVIAFITANLPAIQKTVSEVFGVIRDLWNSVLKPVLTILGNYIKNTLLPIWKTSFGAIKNIVQVAFNGVIALWNNSLKPILNGLISFVSGVLTGNWRKAWNGIKSVVSGVMGGIGTAVRTAINLVKTIFSSGLNVAKSFVVNNFNAIKDTVSNSLDSVHKKVKGTIDKIKGWFSTTLQFKGIKLPDIDIKWKKKPKLLYEGAKLLGLNGVPAFSVKWNAEGGIFNKPVLFGAGEAGAEALAPIDTLQAYINDSVKGRNNDLIQGMEMQMSRLIDYLGGQLPTGYTLRLDSGTIAGEIAPEMNNKLADIYKHNKRGNTI